MYSLPSLSFWKLPVVSFLFHCAFVFWGGFKAAGYLLALGLYNALWEPFLHIEPYIVSFQFESKSFFSPFIRKDMCVNLSAPLNTFSTALSFSFAWIIKSINSQKKNLNDIIFSLSKMSFISDHNIKTLISFLLFVINS